MKPSRRILPEEIVWEDEKTYKIDKILDIRPAASGSGGMGLRYTIRVKGQIKYLFLDEYVWFLEI